VVEQVGLELGESLRINFELAADAAGSITVTTAPVLDVSSSSNVDLIVLERPSELPAGFELARVLRPLAAVASTPATVGIGVAHPPRLEVEGAGSAAVAFRLQGLELPRPWALSLFDGAPELADQIRVQTSGFAAFERGRSVGVIDLLPGGLTGAHVSATLGTSLDLLGGSDRPLGPALAINGARRLAAASSDELGASAGGELLGERLFAFVGGSGRRSELPLLTLEGAADELDLRERWLLGRAHVRLHDRWRLDLGGHIGEVEAAERSGAASATDPWQGDAWSLDSEWLIGTQIVVQAFAAGRGSEGAQDSFAGVLGTPAVPLPVSGRQARLVTSFQVSGGHRLEGGVEGDSETWSPFERRRFGLFLRDVWRPDRRFTIELGLRADVEDIDRERVDGSAALVALETQRSVSPRLGIAYDVLGDGNYKIYLHGGWYREGVDAPQLALALAAPESSLADGGPSSPGRVLELVLGGEQLVIPGLVVSAEVSYRRWERTLELRRQDGVLSLARRRRDTAVVGALVDGGLDRLPRPPGYEALGLEVAADVRVYDGWSLGASYRYRDGKGGREVSLFELADLSALEAAQVGQHRLELDHQGRRHRVDGYAEFRFDNGLAVGAFASYRDGASEGRVIPIAASTTKPAPLVLVIRDGAGRHQPSTEVDLAVRYRLPLGAGGSQLELALEAFNVLDSSAILGRWASPYLDALTLPRGAPADADPLEELAQLQGLGADSRLGEPTRFQAPREARISLRVAF
jgi:hypothetical protein